MADLEALLEARQFDHPRVVAYLDTLAYPELVGMLQAPEVVTTYAEPLSPTWVQGEPRPSLADEDPAVMAAIARCAVSRWRTDAAYGRLAETAVHPSKCGWCEYPLDQLIRALDWATWFSRYVLEEWWVWRASMSIRAPAYRRPTGRAGAYEHPKWSTFAALPGREQTFLTDAASDASRAMLADDPAPVVVPPAEAPSEAGGDCQAMPWCDLANGHPGDCRAAGD